MSQTRKRSRNGASSSSSSNPLMRRTTSLSELAPPARAQRGGSAAQAPAGAGVGAVFGNMQRRHSLDCFPVTETAAFLKVCGLCNRNLGPGRDTFIYMGEVAFCSHECRQKQMNLDELMETMCFPPAGGGGSSDQSGKGSTIAAA
ncbi:hypothetical protein EJB05_45607 [Eragrostis curvula]|uniref:FLZ-type domain-containing protein n=1 Tax=Eragrostis curvula TaxID=38414 RepID=A0A5J9TL28_9POAL|nr:hypothetical protein EJB05_45607 [Eragrostis curvula]